MTFQILALLYLYPFARFASVISYLSSSLINVLSIDLYVHDVKWFIRHHYFFFSILKTAGYIRRDLFDPNESIFKTDLHSTHSYLRIRHLSHLTHLSQSFVPVSMSLTPLSGDLLPSWGFGILCVLPSFIVPSNPVILLNEIQMRLKEDEFFTIPLSTEESTEEAAQILIISSTASLTKTILSHILIPRVTRSEIKECSSNYFDLCHLFTDTANDHDQQQQTPASFLEGITLSTPWKMLVSVTDEMGILAQMNCSVGNMKRQGE
jgi:hypothetical protein